MPLPLPGARCALTAPFHPCLCTRPGPRAIGGLLSVALSVASRRPGVTRHPALWSSDFPRRRTRRRGPHSPPSLFKQPVPRRGLEPPRRFRHQILSLACLPVSAPGQPTLLRLRYAPERTRTSTGLRPLDPESSASTNSATGAWYCNFPQGAPGEIRTPGLLIRSQTLYPAELRAHTPSMTPTTPVPRQVSRQASAPRRNRTFNLGIKSPLLCQLS